VGAESGPAAARKSQLSVSKGSHARVSQPRTKVQRGFEVFDSLHVFDGIAGHDADFAQQLGVVRAIDLVRFHQRKGRPPVGGHLFVCKYRKCLLASLNRIVNRIRRIAYSYRFAVVVSEFGQVGGWI
jgi:hypothetical protein